MSGRAPRESNGGRADARAEGRAGGCADAGGSGPRENCALTPPMPTVSSYLDREPTPSEGGPAVLWTIIVILLVLWLLGFLTGAVGNLIWILLVVAAVVLLFQLLSGRRSV